MGIERREWFVQEEHGRIPRQRARQGDALALAAGELAGMCVV